ncbi:MAG: hypothetical protein GX568_02600 [Candidatus Gastranaerophilales bacterium]|nr:hypothetical protein [Candidatus Gastranaerophilales bacterium]
MLIKISYCAAISQLLVFGGKIFFKSAHKCVALSGLQNIIRLTQGCASLALGWYIAPHWGFCRFAAVDVVVDGDHGVVCTAFRLPYVSHFLRFSRFAAGFPVQHTLKNWRHQRHLRIKQKLAPRPYFLSASGHLHSGG